MIAENHQHGYIATRFAATMLFIVCTLVLPMLMTSCNTPAAHTEQHESAMARILRSGKIRCSYLIYSSYFRKDPNTGQLSGIFHDAVEEIGKNSGLKVEWVEEVGYENIFPGLDHDRYDVFCGGLWPNASRAKAASFTSPIFYSAITAWCRPNDNRFSHSVSSINSPSVKIATIDGAMEDIIAKTDYPKAQRISLPELSPFVLNLLGIVGKKADVTFAEPMVVHEFLAKNPGALKQIRPDQPVRIFGNSLVVKRGETELKDFLDIGLQEIVNNGQVENILEKYEPQRSTFHPIALPYRLHGDKNK